MTEAELEEMQQNWESSADRSDIFKLAVKLIRHDDMIMLEITEHSNLYKYAKLVVEHEEWEDCTARSALFDTAWMEAEHEDWEDNSARSKLFDVCWMEAEHEDWEDNSARSKLFDICLMEAEHEDWEDNSARSKLFDSCWNLTEEEDWEDDSARSALFDEMQWEGAAHERSGLFIMASAELESDYDSSDNDANTLPLPPHWSRSQLKSTSGVLAPLVIDNAHAMRIHVLAAAAASSSNHHFAHDAVQLAGEGKLQTHLSPNNVAAMFNAFPLPALELAH